MFGLLTKYTDFCAPNMYIQGKSRRLEMIKTVHFFYINNIYNYS